MSNQVALAVAQARCTHALAKDRGGETDRGEGCLRKTYEIKLMTAYMQGVKENEMLEMIPGFLV